MSLVELRSEVARRIEPRIRHVHLPDDLKGQIISNVTVTEVGVERRMRSIGGISATLTDEQRTERLANRTSRVAVRVVTQIAESNQAQEEWNKPEIRDNLRRARARTPEIGSSEARCLDGREGGGRPAQGDAHAIKTDGGRIALMRVWSTGEIVPKGGGVQEFLEKSRDQLITSFAHDKCAAYQRKWTRRYETLRNILTSDEIDLIYQAHSRSPEIGHMVLLELTNTRAYQAGHMRARGLDQVEQIAMVAQRDIKTTAQIYRDPLVVERDGRLVLPDESAQRVLDIPKIVKELVESYNPRRHPYMPEPGLHKDGFTDPQRFGDYFKDMIDLSLSLTAGDINYNGTKIHLPQEWIRAQDEIFEYFMSLDRFSFHRRKKATDRANDAVARAYLIWGQTYTHNHNEKYGSFSVSGDNVGKVVVNRQGLRANWPGGTEGDDRADVVCAVLDAYSGDDVEVDPHLIYNVVEQRDPLGMFKSMIDGPLMRRRLDEGNYHPFAVRMEKGIVVEAPHEQSTYV